MSNSTHIPLRRTEGIEKVLDKYQAVKLRTPNSENKANVSLCINTEEDLKIKEDWLVWLGLYHKKTLLFNVDIPQLDGISKQYKDVLLKQNVTNEERARADYFLYVYNLCYAYISDNQSRIFGKANFKDLSHSKSLAIILIAHLCKQGIAVQDESSKAYKNRIKSFVKEMMKLNEITKTTSDDTGTISCASTLDNIFNYKEKDVKNKDDDIKKFYTSTTDTNNTLNTVLDSIDDYVLTTLFGKQIDVTRMRSWKSNKNEMISNENFSVSDDPLFILIFTDPEDKLGNDSDENKIELCKGLTYEIKIDEKSSPFYLKKLNYEALQNLKKLLQLRDKLRVVQNEIKKLLDDTKENTNEFSGFLYLVEPYLQMIQQTKLELHYCLEQFKYHTREVYKTRKKEALDKNWEKCYWKKDKELQTTEGISDLSNKIYGTLTMIPYNYCNAINDKEKKNNKLYQTAEKLTGKEVKEITKKLQGVTTLAVTEEVKRQADLIILKQEGLVQVYDELIQELQNINKNNEDVNQTIEELKNRKECLAKAIQYAKNDKNDHSFDEINASELESEGQQTNEKNDNVKTEAVESEEKQIGFINKVKGWMYNYYDEHASKLKEELNEKTKELIKVQQNNLKVVSELTNKNQESLNKIEKLETEINNLNVNINELNKKIEQYKEDKERLVNEANEKESKILELEKNNKNLIVENTNLKKKILILNENKVSEENLKSENKNASKLINLYFTHEYFNPKFTIQAKTYKEKNDMQDQLTNMLNNLVNIRILAVDTFSAYAENASKDNKTCFFKYHNQAGRNHAASVIKKFMKRFNKKVNVALEKNQKISNKSIGQLDTDLIKAIKESISETIQQEIKSNYSGYRKNSFRNYLRAFYDILIEKGVIKDNKITNNEIHENNVNDSNDTILGKEIKFDNMNGMDFDKKNKAGSIAVYNHVINKLSGENVKNDIEVFEKQFRI